jgi:hypothetical protein
MERLLAPVLGRAVASAPRDRQLVALDVLGGLLYALKARQSEFVERLLETLAGDLRASADSSAIPLGYLLAANYAGIESRKQRLRLISLLRQLQKRHRRYRDAAFLTDLLRIHKQARLGVLERLYEDAFDRN